MPIYIYKAATKNGQVVRNRVEEVNRFILLRRLKNKYSTISSDVITNVFRSAQQKALSIAQGNIKDCPYGTGKNHSRVEDTTRDWDGKDSRKTDDFYIDMDQLVQLTLYCFDKLLYQELGA